MKELATSKELNSKKNICFVLTSLRSGGLEKNATLLANHFVSLGHNVFICCLYSTECFFKLSKETEIIDLSTNKNKLLSISYWIKSIKRIVKEKSINTIISLGDRCGIITAMATNNMSINHICRGVNTKHNLLNKSLLSIHSKNINHFVFQTNAQKDIYSKSTQNKGIIIPNPFELEKSNSNKEGINSKRFVVVASFKLKQKRQDMIIKAFAEFSKNHNDYTLEFYGNIKPKEEQYILKLISSLGLEDKVFVKGETKNVKESIIPSRAFLCCSESEGMPNALIEALSYGIPVITSNWKGYDEIIDNNVNGLVFDTNDMNQLTKLMSNIADDNNLFAKLSDKAWNHLISSFSKDRVLKMWEDLL